MHSARVLTVTTDNTFASAARRFRTPVLARSTTSTWSAMPGLFANL
jgi:hypothetical protein